MKYTRKVDAAKCDGVEVSIENSSSKSSSKKLIRLNFSQADNVIEKLETVIPPGYATNLDVFAASLEKDALSFHPPGELMHSFEKVWTSRADDKKKPATNGHSAAKTYEVYVADGTVPKFAEYHRKMESFILWFIDAASMLDSEDVRWKFYML